MLIHTGDERTETIDLWLAAAMSSLAGALNAAGFQAAGLFSANMTGNVSAMADSLALGAFGRALLFGLLVLAFVAGAMLAATLIGRGRRRGDRAVFARVTMLEAGFLMLLALADLVWPELRGTAPFLAGLSLVMGQQNAATTLISDARVRTTHVSGMATDIGIECAQMFGSAQERKIAAPKLRLHVATICAFLLGGIAGAMLYLTVQGWLFVLAAAVLGLIAITELRRAARLGGQGL